MSLKLLKIKIKSLASEAQIIRKEENKVKYGARASLKENVMEGNRSKADRLYCLYNTLHFHRTVDVRKESRAAQLAYAYIRNMPYEVVEGGRLRLEWFEDDPFVWSRVSDLVAKYSDVFMENIPQQTKRKRLIKEDLKRWRNSLFDQTFLEDIEQVA